MGYLFFSFTTKSDALPFLGHPFRHLLIPTAPWPSLRPPRAGVLSWLHTTALCCPGLHGPARAQTATQADRSREEKRCCHPAQEKSRWEHHRAQGPTLTAIRRTDAFTEVHLSCLRSMTSMNPMPASCKLKRGGETSAFSVCSRKTGFHVISKKTL